jgi:hypothetical protein
MSIFTSQLIKDTTKDAIFKFTATFTDTTNENTSNKIDASLLSNALSTDNHLTGTKLPFYNFTIKRIWFNTSLINNKNIELYWAGSTPSTLLFINTSSGEYNLEASYPTIPNDALSPNGNIGIRTSGVTNSDFYSIIIELHKDNSYYHAGQFFDPGAFNYIINTEIMTENNNFIITESGLSIFIPR